MQLVTIFNSLSVVDADLVNSRLNAAEFHSVVTHANSALSMGGYTLGAGGVLVQVPEDEAKSAREFLAAPDVEPPA